VGSAYEQTTARSLRRDARENRDRILVAARTAFAELGIDASVEEIAVRAGVGVGTLYRRFPTKDALIDAVFEEHLEQVVTAAEHALDAPDAWQGLLGYLTRIVQMQASDCGLSEILGSHLGTERLVGRARERLRPLVEELISRAQEAGDLRADVVYEDVSVLLWTTGRVVDATRDVAPAFWERYLALVVDGLTTPGISALPQPPLTRAKHAAAMRHFAEQHRRASSPRAPHD
jgi:AcrR family transcriptional regulator